MPKPPFIFDNVPDVRDGLTRLQRVILWQLGELQREREDRNVPTAMLYGRVVEHIDVSVEHFQRVLSSLVGAGNPEPPPARAPAKPRPPPRKKPRALKPVGAGSAVSKKPKR